MPTEISDRFSVSFFPFLKARERERESANTELVYSEKSQNASCKENSPDWFLCEGSRSTTDSIIMFIHFGDLFSEKSNHTATTSKSSTSSSTVVVLYTHTRISLQQAYSLLHDTCTATMVCVSTHIDFDEIKRYAEVSFYH